MIMLSQQLVALTYLAVVQGEGEEEGQREGHEGCAEIEVEGKGEERDGGRREGGGKWRRRRRGREREREQAMSIHILHTVPTTMEGCWLSRRFYFFHQPQLKSGGNGGREWRYVE